MCETCFGSRKSNQEQYTSIKEKAKAYAMEKNKTVVIYLTDSGKPLYMEAEAFSTYKPGRFCEYITPMAAA